MAQLIATVHIYDSKELVRFSIHVRRWSKTGAGTHPVVLHLAGDYPGMGETDPRAWLRRALEEALQTL